MSNNWSYQFIKNQLTSFNTEPSQIREQWTLKKADNMIAQTTLNEFKSIVGADDYWDKVEDRALYSFDSSVEEPSLPNVIVRPESTTEVAAICKLCSTYNIPLITRGAGSNLAGSTIPIVGGCVLLMTKMNNILEINRDDLYAVVQPGVITHDFAEAVAQEGLFYPPDPGSQKISTLGGNVAENAGGLRGLKYGVTKDYVMGATFCDMAGNIIKAGGRTVKLCTGFNLTGLMSQSEGQLGVITELILKLTPPIQASKAMLISFDDIIDAGNTVSGIIRNHILPATMELIDNFTIKTIHEATGVNMPIDATALLLLEVDGHPAAVEEEYATVQRICSENNGQITLAQTTAERDQLWEGRRQALSSLAQLRPTLVLEDVTVPRSKIPDFLKTLDRIKTNHDLIIGTFGHAGDGNLHPTILCDERDAQEMQRVQAAVAEMFSAALALGGTCSGEHGIGLSKQQFMIDEVGEGTINYMKAIKNGIDPKNLLNPHKQAL
jgi:glycolate oxidase